MSNSAMENFFYGGRFYADIWEFMIDLEIDEESIESAPDFYICNKGKLEPLVVIDSDWILDMINEDKFSEKNNKEEYEKIKTALSQK